MLRVAQQGRSQHVACQTVKPAFADQDYTGHTNVQAAHEEGIELQIISFGLLPRRWVIERGFGWLNRFGPLARDYELQPESWLACTLSSSPRLHWTDYAKCLTRHSYFSSIQTADRKINGLTGVRS